MQKISVTKKMNYLITQATYHDIEIGLFHNSTCKKKISIQKIEACSSLATTINQLLKEFNSSFSDLSFMGASQGPAPFTTLRVLISTLNGFAFAQNIPLVGIDGLKAFYTAVENNHKTPVILLNAFNKDVYFAYKKDTTVITGWENIFTLLETLKNELSHPINFLGNGTDLFKKEILEVFGKNALSEPEALTHTPLETLAQLALNKFKNNETTKQLSPLYLKTIKLL